MTSVGERLKHAWNAFTGQENDGFSSALEYSPSMYAPRPYAARSNVANTKTIISSIYTRIGIDVASIEILHVRLDEDKRFAELMPSYLNECLTLDPNLDQVAFAFRQDIAMTLFDKGVVAIVPVDTTLNPKLTGAYDIKSLRVGEITRWYPQHVRVSVYNEKKGRREEITVAKSMVAIVENPLYMVMNEPNSTLQRLIRKLSLLDAVDEQSSSGKLDLIIQLPYVVKSESRRQQADQRRKDIEMQLKGSQYGIAYTDGTEKVTQLNRPAENNLMKQVEYLVAKLYSELGLTEEVFNGTADEKTMVNYHNRTIAPILTAITQSMKRAFLTKTARSQGQSIEFYRDPFKLVAVSDIAEIGDKFTRNEILSTNEVRSIMGMRPSKDPKADELRNKNLPVSDEPTPAPQAPS